MALTVAMAAASVQMNNDTQSWFSIKAGANDTAEISIYDEIGGWGISAKAFAKQLKDLGNVKKLIFTFTLRAVQYLTAWRSSIY